MDFVSDAPGAGRRFRVLTIVDEITRESNYHLSCATG
jgi:hypothetical protein